MKVDAVYTMHSVGIHFITYQIIRATDNIIGLNHFQLFQANQNKMHIFIIYSTFPRLFAYFFLKIHNYQFHALDLWICM